MVSVRHIRDRARGILDDFNISKPPVPIEKIVEGFALNIKQVQGTGDYDGELVPERRQISLNVSKPRTRQRFTLAHELGHWVLYHKDRLHELDEGKDETRSDVIVDNGYDEEDPMDDEDWVPDRYEEDFFAEPVDLGPTTKERDTEANIFAAEILMPTQWVRAHWKELGPNVKEIAHRYEVSEDAMWIKVKELGLL